MVTAAAAVLANLLNPKLTIFFFAFLPQFISSQAAHPVLEMVRLGAVFMLMTLAVFGLYGAFAGAARTRLVERPTIIRSLQKAFSLTFVGLAPKLAATTR